jgi:hypothetical protein
MAGSNNNERWGSRESFFGQGVDNPSSPTAEVITPSLVQSDIINPIERLLSNLDKVNMIRPTPPSEEAAEFLSKKLNTIRAQTSLQNTEGSGLKHDETPEGSSSLGYK